MEDQVPSTSTAAGHTNNSEFEDEFYNSGRIGRRNALPDILGYNTHTTTTTADLPERLSALTTNDKDDGSSTSGISSSSSTFINRNQPSTSQACINNSQTSSETGTSSNNVMNNT